LGPAHGGYAFSPKLEPWLREHAREYDAVFVHGLWQFLGRAVQRALRRSGTPYFVFPHGMLDPWFNRAYPMKHLKKWVYWRLCERHVLADAAAVLFTCDEEMRLARTAFSPYRCRERVVAYGAAAPTSAMLGSISDLPEEIAALGGRPYWIFLGRLHPKKGIDLLLAAYRQIAMEGARELPALVIAGPASDGSYYQTLNRQAADLPPNARVIWTGMLERARKWQALRNADAFVLPSHQENFGIAVVEALAMGAPALLSKQVNIWDTIVEKGAGYAAADTFAGTAEVLRRWLETDAATRAKMRGHAIELFNQHFEISRVANSLVETVTPFVSRVAVSTP
jgi:glycosyltransferase involved in cell wall biosynthesis